MVILQYSAPSLCCIALFSLSKCWWDCKPVAFFHSLRLKGQIVEWSGLQCFRMPVEHTTTMASLCASPTASQSKSNWAGHTSRTSQGHVIDYVVYLNSTGTWHSKTPPILQGVPFYMHNIFKTTMLALNYKLIVFWRFCDKRDERDPRSYIL